VCNAGGGVGLAAIDELSPKVAVGFGSGFGSKYKQKKAACHNSS